MGEVGELYTLNPHDGYIKQRLIDFYESLIWTERFIDPGDFELKVPANREFAKLFRPGVMLGLSTSREPMLVDTREAQDGVFTVKGKTIDDFFSNRRHSPLTIFDDPGVAMGDVVENMQTRKNGAEAIPGLRLGPLATLLGGAEFFNLKAGFVKTTLLEIAKKRNIGMAVYLVANEDGTNDLVFSTRYGEFLADGANPVIFSPQTDTLANVREVLTDVGSATVATAYPPSNLSIVPADFPSYTATLKDGVYTGFDRRVAEVSMDFLTKPEQLEGANTTEKLASLWTLMRQKAEAALKPKQKLIDGEITSEARFRYYTERNPDGFPTYRLGDRVRIAGNFTEPQVGILAEYIQSADGTGSRSYPTVMDLEAFVAPDDGGENS